MNQIATDDPLKKQVKVNDAPQTLFSEEKVLNLEMLMGSVLKKEITFQDHE